MHWEENKCRTPMELLQKTGIKYEESPPEYRVGPSADRRAAPAPDRRISR